MPHISFKLLLHTSARHSLHEAARRESGGSQPLRHSVRSLHGGRE